MKRYIKGIVKDEIAHLEQDINGSTATYFDGLSVYFGRVGLKTRVGDLEQKVDLLLKHLGLCKTDVPAKTVLKKCEKKA